MQQVIHLGPDPGRMGETLDWRLQGDPGDEDATTAMQMLKALMVPADREEVMIALAKMRALVVSKRESEDDQTFVLAAYGEQIEAERYPLDVVKQACRETVQLTRFWPSWSEFKERCDAGFLKRKAFHHAMRQYLLRY